MSERILNRTAVREYALHVSEKIRNGKFTRVSEEFVDAVEAELNALIRRTGTVNGNMLPGEMPHVNDCFVTGDAMQKMRESLDNFVQLTVYNKIRRHPTVGVTLKD